MTIRLRDVAVWALIVAASIPVGVTGCAPTPSEGPAAGAAGGTSAGGGATEGNAPRGRITEDGLGASCTLGGSPGVAAAKRDSSCSQGVCVYDGLHPLVQDKTGQRYYDTYCSADCSNADCPAAWECVPGGGGLSVCVKQPAACGDGVKQWGEACDDGNTSSLDGCNASCTASLPSSLNVVSLRAGTSNLKKWFPSLPYDQDGNFAAIVEVTPTSIHLEMRVQPHPWRYRLRIPRRLGVVDPKSTTPGIEIPIDTHGNMLTQTVTEVTGIGADDRSYRVTFAAKEEWTVNGEPRSTAHSGELVVTIPER